MLHCPRARFRKGICGPEFGVRWSLSRVRLPLNRSEIALVSYFTHAVGNRLLFAIFSQPILVRWLSGRKQRFAKAPYLSKGTEGSNPSLTAISRGSNFPLALPRLLSGHVGDENGVPLVGREAHGLKSRHCGI